MSIMAIHSNCDTSPWKSNGILLTEVPTAASLLRPFNCLLDMKYFLVHEAINRNIFFYARPSGILKSILHQANQELLHNIVNARAQSFQRACALLAALKHSRARGESEARHPPCQVNEQLVDELEKIALSSEPMDRETPNLEVRIPRNHTLSTEWENVIEHTRETVEDYSNFLCAISSHTHTLRTAAAKGPHILININTGFIITTTANNFKKSIVGFTRKFWKHNPKGKRFSVMIRKSDVSPVLFQAYGYSCRPHQKNLGQSRAKSTRKSWKQKPNLSSVTICLEVDSLLFRAPLRHSRRQAGPRGWPFFETSISTWIKVSQAETENEESFTQDPSRIAFSLIVCGRKPISSKNNHCRNFQLHTDLARELHSHEEISNTIKLYSITSTNIFNSHSSTSLSSHVEQTEPLPLYGHSWKSRQNSLSQSRVELNRKVLEAKTQTEKHFWRLGRNAST